MGRGRQQTRYIFFCGGKGWGGGREGRVIILTEPRQSVPKKRRVPTKSGVILMASILALPRYPIPMLRLWFILIAIHQTDAWAALREHAASLEGAHLRDMMADADRCAALTAEHDGIFLDYSRQRVTNETMVSLVCGSAAVVRFAN